MLKKCAVTALLLFISSFSLVTIPQACEDWDPSLPAGSYEKSCLDCYRNGNFLRCLCEAKNKRLIDSQLDLRTCYEQGIENISNYNGQLICGECYSRRPARQASLDEMLRPWLQLFLVDQED